MTARKSAKDFDQRLLDLYDEFCHGMIDRRQFVSAVGRHAGAGVSALALVEMLMPDYALAQQVAPDDPRIKTQTITYQSPEGNGPTKALLAEPAWQVTITAGRDAAFRATLEELATRSAAPAAVLGWTDRVPELLMTHHVVISKAGGATTQEAINALCPMIVSQIVPGQEEGNYELLRRHDAGILATTPQKIATALQRAFAGDAALWRHWRGNLRTLARPAAARTIARRVLADTAVGAATPQAAAV